MKHSGSVTYILSAYRPERSERENIQLHMELFGLLSPQFGARQAEGMYNGITELNVVVVATNAHEARMRSIAADFQQECFLKVYADGWAEFVAPNGNRLGAGTLQSVPEAEAKQSIGYTKLGNSYYVVKQKESA